MSTKRIPTPMRQAMGEGERKRAIAARKAVPAPAPTPTRLADSICVRIAADERAFVDRKGGSPYVRGLIASALKRESRKGGAS